MTETALCQTGDITSPDLQTFLPLMNIRFSDLSNLFYILHYCDVTYFIAVFPG